MKREPDVDFFIVEPGQIPMHDRLCNWAFYVQDRRPHWQAPIWKLGKSNGRQWYIPEPRALVDQLDGMALEKAVGLLPIPHREALRWHYVYRTGPAKARRALGVTNEGLVKLVHDGRLMLTNRGV